MFRYLLPLMLLFGLLAHGKGRVELPEGSIIFLPRNTPKVCLTTGGRLISDQAVALGNARDLQKSIKDIQSSKMDDLRRDLNLQIAILEHYGRVALGYCQLHEVQTSPFTKRIPTESDFETARVESLLANYEVLLLTCAANGAREDRLPPVIVDSEAMLKDLAEAKREYKRERREERRSARRLSK